MSKEAIDYLLFKEKFLTVDLFSWDVLESEFEYLYDLDDEEYEIEVERLMREEGERYFWHEDYLDREDILCEDILISKDQSVLSLNFYQFLHGFCDIFAVALAKRFDYDVLVAFCRDWSTGKYRYLVHSYCIDKKGNHIDVRGVLPPNSGLDMLEEFEEYGAENVCYQRFSVDEAIQFFKRFIKESSQAPAILNTANLILDLFPEKYYVNS